MFAGAFHKALIKLKPGEEILYRLPPMSEGPIFINAFDAYFTDGPQNTSIAHSSKTSDLKLELQHQDLKLSGTNTISYGVLPGQVTWHDNLWRLWVKRVQPASEVDQTDEEGRLQYRIEAQYPSQLPILERRIPASFFHDGFEVNWNQQEYINVRFIGHRIEINIREDLALLYDLPLSGFVIHTGDLSFEPTVELTPPLLDIGVGPLPWENTNTPFFSVQTELPKAVRLENHNFGPNAKLDLPPCKMTVRFYLHAGGKFLDCWPIFDTNVEIEFGIVLDIVDVVGGPDEKEVLELFKKKLEEGLTQIIVDHKFSEFLSRWLVGGQNVINPSFSVNDLLVIDYAPGSADTVRPNGFIGPPTGELMVYYIGPHAKPTEPVAVDPTNPPSPPDDHSVPLFDPLPDEEPEPVPGQGSSIDGPLGGVEPHSPGASLDIGPLAKIKHIVVLMQENRSFDQVLGYLSRDKIDPRVEGLPPDEPGVQQPFNQFGNLNFFPQKVDAAHPPRTRTTAWPSTTSGPCHDFDCVLGQMNDNMAGFVADFAKRLNTDATDPRLRLIMDYFGPDDLPVYAVLAREFGICDHWYTSHAGPTWPNRFVLLTGDLSRDPVTNRPDRDNPDMKTMIPLQTPTLFDYLTEAGASWRVFEHGYSFLRLFGKFTFDTKNIVPFDDPKQGFERAAVDGALPQVTLIEPDYIELPPGNDDHAPADMAAGQDLVNRIVRALIASPDWESTLFIITYDEHGGFYDHVNPANDAPPLGGSFTKLGPRVPAFIVSPLVKRGDVFHSRFDHTSIGATILRRFAGPRPPSVSPRMDAALDLREVLTLANSPRPRTDFGSLGLPQVLERPRVSIMDVPERKKPIRDFEGKDDFHGLLAAMRLVTGEPPKVTKGGQPPKVAKGGEQWLEPVLHMMMR